MRIALAGAEFEENLAVRYIWGALEAAGHEVVQVVFNDEAETERAARELAESGTELAGFSMVFTYRAREFADLATRARQLGYRGHMVAGGHFAAFNAEALLRDVSAFESIAVGEGEAIMADLAGRLDDPSAVRGLVWRNATGEIVRNAPAAKPPDLDALPCPVRKDPPDDYLGLPIVNMLSSRGCTHACAFCSIAAWHKLCGGRRFRQRTPENVAEEMAALYERGVRIFNFHDDNFLLQSGAASLGRLRALKRELDGRGVGRIAFAIKARPDSVGEELFAYMKSMGLFRVFLGVEAGTAESLRKLGRGQTKGDNERALATVNRLDLHTCFNLLMLNPDSTLEDFAANVAFLRRHPRNPMNFCRTEIYAGTPLEAKLRREGRLIGDYWGYDYRIADPRAQQLFEIVFAAFAERNYGEDGLHHMAMNADYEHQLCAHFLGQHDALRQRVKDYVVAVNLNTCQHLERIVEAVGAGLSDRDQAELVRDGTARVRADNRELLAAGHRLLDEIRRTAAAAFAGPSRRQALKTVAAGMAAALGVLNAGCENSHTTETAPRPPSGDARLIREAVRKHVLPSVVRRLDSPHEVRIVVSTDGAGKAAAIRATAFRPNGAKEQAIEADAFSGVLSDRPGAANKTFSLLFGWDDVKALMPKQDAPPLREQVASKLIPLVRDKLAKPCRLQVHVQVDALWEMRSCELKNLDTDQMIAVLRGPDPDIILRNVDEGTYTLTFSPTEVAAALAASAKPAEGTPAKKPGTAGKPPAKEPADLEEMVVKPFVEWALPFIAPRIRPAADIQIELQVDKGGRVVRSAIRGVRLSRAAAKAIDERLGMITFDKQVVFGKTVKIPVKKARIEALQKELEPPRPPKPIEPIRPPTHPTEMAPFPSHPHERAPRPRRR